MNKEVIRESIRKNYSKVATNGSHGGCCNGGGCGCATDVKESSLMIGYEERDVQGVPLESNMGLGCGNPIAIAALSEGETVLDLGCGGGFDCFLARKRVGERGYVIGVDMTPDMVTLARKNVEKANYTNIDIRLGEIENLPVADNTIDVIISNCVINLSQDKEQVFREAYRVLRPMGRLSISDVVSTAPLPSELLSDLTLISSCISGAVYIDDLKIMLSKAGFKNVTLTPKDNSREIIKSWAANSNMEDYVASYYIEAIK